MWSTFLGGKRNALFRTDSPMQIDAPPLLGPFETIRMPASINSPDKQSSLSHSRKKIYVPDTCRSNGNSFVCKTRESNASSPSR
ncbi:hypothetical protein CEXT_176731 [Caerostris extrusa]|uniref:Uncharacterized protein n=1 Tax=Caerostris extrusa TaxID=172846 RepID=A0AAV4Y5G3_CAEEX|nr:hypothetical protein CEXT_176731 [Caerostris extrusa]